MYHVRVKMDFGEGYLSDPNLRASRLLGIEWEFWLQYVEIMKTYNSNGKILFRARREDPGGWAIADTVFDSEQTYNEYFAAVNGARIEQAMTDAGYQWIKEIQEIDDLEVVINERPHDQTYYQLVSPEYAYLLPVESDL